ncbi:MAG: integrase core domain-containing protein, partial [Burkholderia sp.]
SPSGSALATCRLIAKSCLNNRIRYTSASRINATTPLRSDNGLVFTSRDYARLVRSYRLKQEFITPHCPQQNGMVERVIRTLKEQRVHRHRFESQTHALRVIAD